MYTKNKGKEKEKRKRKEENIHSRKFKASVCELFTQPYVTILQKYAFCHSGKWLWFFG